MTDNPTSRPVAEGPAESVTGTSATPPAPPAPTTNRTGRRRALTILGLIVLLGAIAWGVHAWLTAGTEEETDDAYVAGDVVAITSREPGTILAIHADNTQAVKRGQSLIDLDPATIDVNLASAAAELARSVRAVRSDFSQVDEGKATVIQAEAELSRAQNDLKRRQGAAKDGAVSGEEVAHAADSVKTAQAMLTLARSKLAQAQSSVEGASVSTNPAVLAAIARYRNAAIMKSHMRLVAPVDGVIAQRTVQLGQQVAPGTPLMAVVPLRSVWVDANFRETQLRHVRIGQPATVTADVYGGDVKFHGRVIGLGAGSGSAFALLPPQNASGNWIKIVQRLPVRIALDPKELDQHPLRIGLSTKVTVDIRDRSGSLLAQQATGNVQSQSGVDVGPATDAEIRRIVAANSGDARR